MRFVLKDRKTDLFISIWGTWEKDWYVAETFDADKASILADLFNLQKYIYPYYEKEPVVYNVERGKFYPKTEEAWIDEFKEYPIRAVAKVFDYCFDNLITPSKAEFEALLKGKCK